MVREGGKRAYIKQQNSGKGKAFLEERNGRGREQSPGSFGAEGSILQESCDLVTPCADARGDFQALTPCHHKRQESRGLLRSEIQDECLQNYCTETKASLGRGTGPQSWVMHIPVCLYSQETSPSTKTPEEFPAVSTKKTVKPSAAFFIPEFLNVTNHRFPKSIFKRQGREGNLALIHYGTMYTSHFKCLSPI